VAMEIVIINLALAGFVVNRLTATICLRCVRTEKTLLFTTSIPVCVCVCVCVCIFTLNTRPVSEGRKLAPGFWLVTTYIARVQCNMYIYIYIYIYFQQTKTALLFRPTTDDIATRPPETDRLDQRFPAEMIRNDKSHDGQNFIYIYYIVSSYRTYHSRRHATTDASATIHY